MKRYGHKLVHISMMTLLSILMYLPLFFQLNGKIFNDRSFNFDSMGELNQLPIPVSVFTCFYGLLIIGNYRVIKESTYFIISMFIIMLGASFVSTNYHDLRTDKLLFLFQFILPIFWLVLGQIYGSQELSLIHI